jgi:hypothetical protein
MSLVEPTTGYHKHRGGKGQHCSGRRNRRRMPLSEIMINCPYGTTISMRELNELCEAARSSELHKLLKGLSADLLKVLPRPQSELLSKWMRGTTGRKRLTEDRADELVAVLVIRAAERVHKTPTWMRRQLLDRGDALDYIIKRFGNF